MESPTVCNGSTGRPCGQFCGRTRREFFWELGGGFVSVALAGLLEREFFAKQALAADGITKLVQKVIALS